MTNISNSLLFLNIARNTIYEIYEEKELKYFIQNEASDYQIMSILINNKIPEEKYNITQEYKLWESFQQLVYENTNIKSLQKIVVEMGPISEYNISSTKPILEFLLEDQPKYVQGLFNKLSAMKKTAKSTLKKGTDAATKLAADTASKGTMGKIAVGMSAGAAASIVAFAAAKIYQQYLSKAARACKGKPEKAACMKEFKNKAMIMRISKLRSGVATCSKAKNPENCKKSLQSKISKLQLRIDKL